MNAVPSSALVGMIRKTGVTFTLRHRIHGWLMTGMPRASSSSSCMSTDVLQPSTFLTSIDKSSMKPPQHSSNISVLSCINLTADPRRHLQALWEDACRNILEVGILLISTLKRRRKMMNKHKLRKRRKKNRMKNKK